MVCKSWHAAPSEISASTATARCVHVHKNRHKQSEVIYRAHGATVELASDLKVLWAGNIKVLSRGIGV